MNQAAPMPPELLAMRSAGAAKADAVGWHYIETLARRSETLSGPAQVLLRVKLQEALQDFEKRRNKVEALAKLVPVHVTSSPLAQLLQDMVPPHALKSHGEKAPWPTENPRIQQFRQQLSKISVQKQVTQALAQAPPNAGPINSHMLVLRSLGWMRDISPDYLNRFMAHVDTLLCLEEADQRKVKTPKSPSSAQASP